MKPEHEHDCNSCIFLGNYYSSPKKICDMYYCKGSDGGTIIIRNSSDGPDYWSMPVCMLINPIYKHGRQAAANALSIAIKSKVITEKDLYTAAQYI